MTAQLPPPGSTWLQLETNRPMRVAPAGNSASDITAHDCEMTAPKPIHVTMMSWRGTAEEFFKAFVPFDPDFYPRTA